ncbi:MAG: hypothetical protein ACUVRS_10970 [Armatimonadota bacterium]
MNIRALLVCLLASSTLLPALAQEAIRDQARCYITWDDFYFYAGFKVDWPDVQGKHNKPNEDVSGDDTISVYLQTNDSPNTRINTQCFVMSVSAAGGAQFSQGTEQGSFEPKKVYTFKYGATVQGTINDSDDVDEGFSVEMALPWEIMNSKAPQLGSVMRFNVLIRRHGAKSGDFVSLAPEVRSEEDVTNPSKWMRMVFTTYSFGALMPESDKLVCAKTLVRPPLINGVVEGAEWSKNWLFVMDLPMPEGFVYEAKYPVPKLTFTHYFYWYQADPRRGVPVGHIVNDDGSLALQDVPVDGIGPWFSSDRVEWHKKELSEIASAGIDVVLPIYWGDKGCREAWSVKGLDCMVSALRELESEGKPYPLVAMFFDTTAMQLAYAAKPNLRDEEVKRTFYGMIKDFFERIPPEYRALAPAGKPNAGIPGCIVFLYTSNYFSDFDDSFTAYCSERFERDFGCPLIWIAAEDFKRMAGSFDGYSSYGAGLVGPICLEGGRIRIGSVGAGFDDSPVAVGRAPRIRSRMGGETYERDWQRVLEHAPQWVVFDGWNELYEGSDLCASRQYGRKYIEATRSKVAQFAGDRELDVRYIRYSVPRVIPQRQIYQAELVISNKGKLPWLTSDGYALAYRWYRNGRFLSESKVRRVIDRDVVPGKSVRLQIGIATVNERNQPLPEGDCEIRFELVRLKDNKWFSVLGVQPLILPVTIGAPGEWRATYVECDVPVMVASRCNYLVRVRVRNEGTVVWSKGITKLACRLFKVANYKHDSPEEVDEQVPTKQIRALLQRDCKPGEIAEFVFILNLSLPDGSAIPVWNPGLPWSYQLRFDIYNGKEWLSELGSPPLKRTVGIYESDYGVRVVDSNLPAKLEAGKTYEVKVVIRNVGAVTWDRHTTTVGYHWFHLDGMLMQLDMPTQPLLIDLKPGLPAMVSVKVKAPEYDGRYILVWDVKVGNAWASTQPLVRGGDMVPFVVEVGGGRLVFVDLSEHFDTVMTSWDTDRSRGDFDGNGYSFPAELMPPDFAPGGEQAEPVYPSGYLCGLNSYPDGRISFRYPNKSGEGAKQAVSCGGQTINVPEGRYNTVHILGASTGGGVSGAIDIVYADGSDEANIRMSDWTSGPGANEAVAFVARHLHSPQADEIGRMGYLYHYTIQLDAGRVLRGLRLPQNRNMKVVAITLERPAQ